MPSALIDTGVWYSFYDSKDTPCPREDIDALAEMLEPMKILVPWPMMYETIRTRFARNNVGMTSFERQLKSMQIEFIGVQYFATYNVTDFHDVCAPRGIELLPF